VIESVYVKFDESTNFWIEKGHSIIGEEVQSINSTHEGQAIEIEEIQEPPTIHDAPTTVEGE
jgi:hypothetical protein